MDNERPEARVSIKPAICSNPHNQATLLGLPREMRNEIYTYLLASGHLSILRSCRQLSEEALELIYKEAIFRVSVNSAQSCHNVQPGVEDTEKIQNLQLDWQLSDFDCERNASEVIDFCQRQQQLLKTCHVILRFGPWRFALLSANDITALKSLRVFRNVIIEPVVNDSAEIIPDGLLPELQSRSFSMLTVLDNELQRVLGPAEYKGGASASCLVFHPSRMSVHRLQELPLSNTDYGF